MATALSNSGQGKAEPNDTYIEQLVAHARAAIKAVDDMGVVVNLLGGG